MILKDKNGTNVMPETTAESVVFDAQKSVKVKIMELEQNQGGGSDSSHIALANLFDTADVIEGRGAIYNTKGTIQDNGKYASVFIPLEYGKRYCVSGYRLSTSAKIVALAKGTKTSFDNLLVSDLASGNGWAQKDTFFTRDTQIFATKANIPNTFVFMTPAQEDMVDGTTSIGIVINVKEYYSGAWHDEGTLASLTVVDGLYPVEYGNNIKGKNVAFFGDSVTAGSGGSFVDVVKSALSLNIADNFGSNGSATSRLVNIVMGAAVRSGDSAGTYKDYARYHAVVIQIGTNGGVSGSIESSIPSSVAQDISPEDYSNDFYGNLALCIDHIRSVNPNCRVYLTTIPPNTGGYGKIETVNPAIKELGNLMGVPVIDAQSGAGLSVRNIDYWSSDPSSSQSRTHFNDEAKELWGKYIARFLESNWYDTDLS